MIQHTLLLPPRTNALATARTLSTKNTGSYRLNDERKTVFTGITFHKNWVFTGVSGSEFAAILSSAASMSPHSTLRIHKTGAPNVPLGSPWGSTLQ